MKKLFAAQFIDNANLTLSSTQQSFRSTKPFLSNPFDHSISTSDEKLAFTSRIRAQRSSNVIASFKYSQFSFDIK
jgi:hypothetical protein